MSEKTEPPTPKRLREAREKGQVAKSKEVVSTALLLSIFGLMWGTLDSTFNVFGQMMILPGNLTAEPFWSALSIEVQNLLQAARQILLPILGVVIVVAVMAHFFQYGLLLSFKALQPSMKKLNPASNIKNIIGKKNFLEFLKSLLKVILLSLLIVMVIRDSIDPLLKSPICGGPCVEAALAAMLKQVVIFSSAAFIVVAAADYLIEKRLYLKELMMSKDEIKREYKEMEGDPHIKGKRRQLHQELVNEDTVQKARKATVIVTNPTEVAVALYYNKDETPLPVVLTKAKDLLARRIIEVAREEGIPIMQNVPLAHSLYNEVGVSEFIPSELIEPVAEVLRFVQSLRAAG